VRQAARDAMVEGCFVEEDLLASGFGHSGYSYSKLHRQDAKSCRISIRPCSQFLFTVSVPHNSLLCRATPPCAKLSGQPFLVVVRVFSKEQYLALRLGPHWGGCLD